MIRLHSELPHMSDEEYDAYVDAMLNEAEDARRFWVRFLGAGVLFWGVVHLILWLGWGIVP